MPIDKHFSDDLVAGAAIRDGEGNIISSSYVPVTILVDECNLWELDVGLYKATVKNNTSFKVYYKTNSITVSLDDGEIFQVYYDTTTNAKHFVLTYYIYQNLQKYYMMKYVWSTSSTEGGITSYDFPIDSQMTTPKAIVTYGGLSSKLSEKEDVSNKVTTIDSTSTDTQYPSAKAVYDNLTILSSDIDTVSTTLTGKEDVSNKVTIIDSNSTDTQYPSAKLMYDQLALKLNRSGGTITKLTVSGALKIGANMNANNKRIYGVATPTSTSDATNKAYVDAADALAEKLANKVDTIDSTSTTIQYPSAKCVYDNLTTLSSSISAISTSLTGKEDTSNKVTTLSSANTDTEYPSAKCVYDLIGDINTILATLVSVGGAS